MRIQMLMNTRRRIVVSSLQSVNRYVLFMVKQNDDHFLGKSKIRKTDMEVNVDKHQHATEAIQA
jgi:hypothetical protein